jgi:ATP-dependent DNA helicase DinG
MRNTSGRNNSGETPSGGERAELAAGLLPRELPAMVAAGTGARLQAGMECSVEDISARQALMALAAEPHLVCHAGMLARRVALSLGDARAGDQVRGVRHWDVAELFAFVLPAAVAPPLPSAIGRLLGLMVADDDPAALRLLAEALLAHVASKDFANPRQALHLATYLKGTRWPWADAILNILDKAHGLAAGGWQRTGLEIWEDLPEWEEAPPQPPPGQQPVAPEEAQALLRRILGRGAEARPAQMEYAAEVARAFAPRPGERENTILLAEAGTGLGKTLGYLAPAIAWSRKNAGSVCIATYTKNLQRQLLAETRRIWSDRGRHRRHVAVRKGRENYLCLLNAQERFASIPAGTAHGAALAALIARWALASADGDMVGGDFPAWLPSLLGEAPGSGQLTPMAMGLTDRRGECTFAACPHYRRCFIERNRVRAARADIIIANHAVVMIQAATERMLGLPGGHSPSEPDPALARLVLDEGHHLFDAADSAFSGHLTALETRELRRWLRGPEESRRRGRPLRERLGDLLDGHGAAAALVRDIEEAARCLPGPGWRQRIAENIPKGAAEVFLAEVHRHVKARTASRPAGNELEADCFPASEALLEAAEALETALGELIARMRQLAALLLKRLEEEARELTSADRNRLESLSRSLMRRGEAEAGGWRVMLRQLLAGEDGADARFASWFAIHMAYGQMTDTGMHMHWVDPTLPLAETVLAPADSVVITSATLRDRPPRQPDDWQSAEMRTGVLHLPWAARRVSFPSPFDYGKQTRVLVVTDVNRDDMDQVAAAYRELFLAAGGGALGLFTAISRLRAVHGRILPALAAAGLPLYAQHVDDMDTGTLVDIFRCQEDACLLGTDAVRDGVDVPGRSLRLLVMDRVPWPRPTILERARRAAFGHARWTDMIVRLKLRQAFGRLIRRASDRGVFVMLDPRLASRFHTAFPQEVTVRRTGLADAVALVRSFLRESAA